MAINDSPGNFSQRYSTIVQTVTVVALFVGGFWAGVINPLATGMERLESRLSDRMNKIEDKVDNFQVTLAEYREFHAKVDAAIAKIQEEQNKRRDLFVTQVDHAKIEAAIARMDSEISKIRDSEVTRGEHTQKWASDAATFAILQRQIDEIKKDFGASFSLNDKLKELQTELNEMRKGKQ
jgi:predicted  nucleic acid-binding Zn-ribbon protein